MSRRAVLYAGVELEQQGEALLSAESIVMDAEKARISLPSRSEFDESLEVLQDGCNQLRLDIRSKEDQTWVFGDALYEFRALVLSWAQRVFEATRLDEARRLAEKIDLSNARQPMGPSIAAYASPPPRSRPTDRSSDSQGN
jgi:hypothetical protein